MCHCMNISDAIWQWETRHVLPMLLGQPPKWNLLAIDLGFVHFLHSTVWVMLIYITMKVCDNCYCTYVHVYVCVLCV